MLELNNIQIIRNQRTILSIPSLQLSGQQITVILGHNGSGKSTLMKLLARQLQPDQGQLYLHGQSLKHYRQKILAQQIAYLPQQLPTVAGLSVRELVKLGRFAWRGSFGRWHPDDYHKVNQAISDTHISELSEQLVDDLSGGERQRAWVAMLVAQQSPLLLLDEPTAALDPAHQYELMTLLRQLNRQHQRGIVVILHDINLAIRYADRILALKQGRICFDGTPEALLTPKHLKALYGIEMEIITHPNLPVPCVAING